MVVRVLPAGLDEKLNGLCMDMAGLKGAMRMGFIALAMLGAVGTGVTIWQAAKPPVPVVVQVVSPPHASVTP